MVLSYIEVLRFLATLLIANSHFKGVYPIDSLSFGGGFGLAVFYMLIGFLSTKIDSKTKFLPWYLKKLARIYIPLWIVRLLEYLLGFIIVTDFNHFISLFIFPTRWFVASMVVFYALYFMFYKYLVYPYGMKPVISAICMMMVIFAVMYITCTPIGLFSFESLHCDSDFMDTPSLMMQCIWAISMLIGCGMKISKKEFTKATFKYLVLIISCLIVFYIIKGLVSPNYLYACKWILGPCYIIFSLGLFSLFSGIESWCQKMLQTPFGKGVKMISSSSIEIYYVQFFWINCLKKMIFPVNLVLLIVTITISGYLIHLLTNRILKVM